MGPIGLSPEYLEGRRGHLHAKLRVCKEKLTHPELPDQEHWWKLRVQIPKIEAALARIERGEYGECLECGELIPIERLDIRPETARCRECESFAEARHAALA